EKVYDQVPLAFRVVELSTGVALAKAVPFQYELPLKMLTPTEATPLTPVLSVALPVMAPLQVAVLYAAAAGKVIVETGGVVSTSRNEVLGPGFSTLPAPSTASLLTV